MLGDDLESPHVGMGLVPARVPWEELASDGLEGSFVGGLKGPSKRNFWACALDQFPEVGNLGTGRSLKGCLRPGGPSA
jgi:hypothetical protein